jgi:hypothetical protein
MDTALARRPRPHPHSYYFTIAAIALDLINREGIDVVHELIFPNHKACQGAICALAAQALPARNVV